MNSKKNLNVPNLRFPEFSGEWEEKKLAEITSKIGSGKTPKGGEEVYTNEGIPFIRSQNVINDSLTLDSTHIPQAVHESMKGSKVLPNDILLNITGGSIGRSCVVPNDFTEGNVNQHVSIIRLQNDNPRFLQPILSSWRGQKLVFQGMTGSGREGLNFESIKSFKINFPTVDEQNRIASLLTILDERIQTQSKIIEDYKLFKKGIMQKIFNQELRFKDKNGNDFLDWEEKKLGEVLSYKQPTKHLVSDTEYSDDYKTPVLTAGKTFLLGYTNETEGIFKEGLPTIIFDDFTTAFQFVDFPFKAKSSAMKMLIPANKEVNIRFIYEVMTTINFPLSEHKRYWISEYQHVKIPYPCRVEQQKIASTLSSLDRKIDIETTHLVKLKTQKQYLLQNLFI